MTEYLVLPAFYVHDHQHVINHPSPELLQAVLFDYFQEFEIGSGGIKLYLGWRVEKFKHETF